MSDTNLVIHYSKLRHLLAVFFITATAYVFDRTYKHEYPDIFYYVAGIILFIGFIVSGIIAWYSAYAWHKLEKSEEGNKEPHRRFLEDYFLYVYLLIMIAYIFLAHYVYHNPHENSTTGNTVRREHTTVTNTTKTITDTLKEVTQSEQDNK